MSGYAAQRLTSLSGLITGMIHTGSSHLSKIGTGLPQPINALSKETHAKRFLENRHVDIKAHYLPYLKQFLLVFLCKKGNIKTKQNIYVVVDGSQTGSKHVTLMLSLVVANQAIPLFWVVRKGKKGHFPTEMHLDVVGNGIQMLQQMLASLSIDAAICLLGDGEFDSVELQLLCRNTLKIDYVLRTAIDSVLYDEGDKISPKFIHHTHRSTGKKRSFFIPNIEFSNTKLEKVHFLYWFDAKKYKDPLFLISSLDNAPDIKYAYALRFRIETMFKDFKSRGFNLHKNRLDEIQAITNLIIVAALSFCIILNFGDENEDNPIKIKVQRIDKKINSKFTYARLLFQYCQDEDINIPIIDNKQFVECLAKMQT